MTDNKDVTKTASKTASAAADNKDEESLFHVLLLPEGETIDSRRKVDETLRHDYLGKRYEAYKALNQRKERQDDPVWSGAQTTEKWLIWCCELPELSAVDQEDFTLPGALRRDRVLKFVGYLALYCHDIISRALALSILERTLEADLPAMQLFDALQQQAVASGTTASATLDVDTKRDVTSEVSSPSTRTRKRMLEAATTPDPANASTTVLAPPPRKPDRLWQFMAAGGLKILDQWIEDASKPVHAAKAPPGEKTSKTPASKESPTAALLLPLLVLLRDLPFDKQLVTQSKINRQIRKLSKDIDALVETKKTKKMTHPRAGGYPVVEVQEALNELKSAWNTQQKLASAKESPPDPFQSVQEALQRRLGEMKDFQTGKIEQPAWLAEVWKEPDTKEPPAKKKRPMSTEEMNRIDHQHERNARIKEDLQKAEQERIEYQKRLREIKSTHAAQQQQQQQQSQAPATTGRRRVRWRDGMSHVSLSRKRQILEEVFVFIKNTSAASGLVPKDSSDAEEDVADMIVEGKQEEGDLGEEEEESSMLG